MVDAELTGNRMGLVNASAPSATDIQLLERHDIGRAGSDDLGNTGWRQAAIRAETSAHVVGQDP